MKIISSKHFLYSDLDKTAWESALFHPISDHKFSVSTEDDLIIECATFRLIEKGKEEIHACISSQAGCKFGCKFCVSGKRGFVRNLRDTEIIGQLQLMAEHFGIKRFDHVVFMGIGEPLDNLKNVSESIRQLITDDPWYAKKLSLCTAGIVDKFKPLLECRLPLRYMWLSLHAATDVKRRLIMPIAKTSSVLDLVTAASNFTEKSGTPICLNYMILQGFNDRDEDAAAFADLLKQNPKLVAMITIPNGNVNGFCSGTKADVKNFHRRLLEAGVKNKIVHFLAAGRSVNAGCGELIFKP